MSLFFVCILNCKYVVDKIPRTHRKKLCRTLEHSSIMNSEPDLNKFLCTYLNWNLLDARVDSAGSNHSQNATKGLRSSSLLENNG